MTKKLPKLTTDEAARDFLENTDLTDYLDHSATTPLTRAFETTNMIDASRPSPPPNKGTENRTLKGP